MMADSLLSEPSFTVSVKVIIDSDADSTGISVTDIVTVFVVLSYSALKYVSKK